MPYKLIGVRPSHKQMKAMVGTHLYKINYDKIEKVYIIGVRISDTTNKWEFVLTGENKPNEPLFISIKSVKRYAKKNGIELV